MSKASGMNYAPKGKTDPVVRPGQFGFAAVSLEHGHIYGMCNGLVEAGADLKWVYDPDPVKVRAFLERFPGTPVAESETQVLEDQSIMLAAGAAVPCDRCDLGLRVQQHGKHYFTDKTPFTTGEQLELARQSVKRTGLKWYVYFSERLHVEGAVMAGKLIEEGRIGRVLQVLNIAPHRLNKEQRPAWFFQREKFGGILCDIGSHQIEQFLHYTGASDAQVLHAKVANYANPDHPEFEDFGDATLLADNGATQYLRVDWFNPDGLRTWGDGRLFIMGTNGSIEVRKYLDVARSGERDHVFLVTGEKEEYISAAGKTGFPFFGQFVLDCLNGTEHSMTQQHVFKAAELCLEAQRVAVRIR
ncbi:MAG TPA: Gfo/Idh/MocA family oxidoreductase [Anaerolineae bacterium]|nr:Gfo/Idh/MocA family oxidoreductase [Anaerolineae bacterium]